jgi:hypothetical protein
VVPDAAAVGLAGSPMVSAVAAGTQKQKED